MYICVIIRSVKFISSISLDVESQKSWITLKKKKVKMKTVCVSSFHQVTRNKRIEER